MRPQSFWENRYGPDDRDMALVSDDYDIYVIAEMRTVIARSNPLGGVTYRTLSTHSYQDLDDAYDAARQIAATLAALSG